MTEMVERIAKAINPRAWEGEFLFEAWRTEAQAAARQAAVRALEALRQPTKEMILAAETALEDFTDEDWDSDADGNRYDNTTRRDGWEAHVLQSMIDAALKD